MLFIAELVKHRTASLQLPNNIPQEITPKKYPLICYLMHSNHLRPDQQMIDDL